MGYSMSKKVATKKAPAKKAAPRAAVKKKSAPVAAKKPAKSAPKSSNDVIKRACSILKDSGAVLSKIGEDIGVERGQLFFILNTRKSGLDQQGQGIAKAIQRRVKILNTFKVTEDNLDSVLKEVGLRESYFARAFGISRQAFNQQKNAGFSEAAKKKLQGMLREMAQEFARAHDLIASGGGEQKKPAKKR
jgi:hypothetical protein